MRQQNPELISTKRADSYFVSEKFPNCWRSEVVPVPGFKPTGWCCPDAAGFLTDPTWAVKAVEDTVCVLKLAALMRKLGGKCHPHLGSTHDVLVAEGSLAWHTVGPLGKWMSPLVLWCCLPTSYVPPARMWDSGSCSIKCPPQLEGWMLSVTCNIPHST